MLQAENFETHVVVVVVVVNITFKLSFDLVT
jgi:hypothetical protein